MPFAPITVAKAILVLHFLIEMILKWVASLFSFSRGPGTCDSQQWRRRRRIVSPGRGIPAARHDGQPLAPAGVSELTFPAWRRLPHIPTSLPAFLFENSAHKFKASELRTLTKIYFLYAWIIIWYVFYEIYNIQYILLLLLTDHSTTESYWQTLQVFKKTMYFLVANITV